MTAIAWDQTGQRLYETGVDHGVLYDIDPTGEYVDGVAWNGLTTVTESPSGAEATPTWADNMKYLNLISTEQFGATIEAYTYPPEFGKHDGSASPAAGVMIGQQKRKPFGFCYRTLLGNDLDGTDHGYKLHLVYGANAAPSEKAYATVNDTPEAINFSWQVTTTPVPVGTIGGVDYKPTATITIDSTTADPDFLDTLLSILYGDESNDPSMPLPADIISMMTVALTEVIPNAPTYNNSTHTITIPSQTGVIYKIGGVTKPAGAVVITADTVVKAYPASGYKFAAVSDNDWFFDYS